MLIVLWLLSFLFFTFFYLTIFYLSNRAKWNMQNRISTFIIRRPLSNVPEKGGREKVRSSFLNYIRRYFIEKMSRHQLVVLDRKLQEAGNPFGMKAVDFRILQITTSVTLFILSVFILFSTTNEFRKTIFLSLCFSLLGFLYFSFYIGGKRKTRMIEIEKSMPDFFDLVTISIEAGMGLDGALVRVCRQMNSPLSSEFLLTLEDMRLGKSRRQAFVDLRDRIPSEFFKSIMNSIIQADQWGIGMSKVLKAQTERIRENQRQRVKEQAAKAPVKMLFPMILFIFPMLFIVLLGPVVITLLTTWL